MKRSLRRVRVLAFMRVVEECARCLEFLCSSVPKDASAQAMNGFSSRSISEGLSLSPAFSRSRISVTMRLPFLLFVVAQIAVEHVLAAHGVVDLDFAIVFVELGEIHNAIPPGGFRFAVNFKHHLFGLNRESHVLTRPS